MIEDAIHDLKAALFLLDRARDAQDGAEFLALSDQAGKMINRARRGMAGVTARPVWAYNAPIERNRKHETV